MICEYFEPCCVARSDTWSFIPSVAKLFGLAADCRQVLFCEAGQLETYFSSLSYKNIEV